MGDRAHGMQIAQFLVTTPRPQPPLPSHTCTRTTPFRTCVSKGILFISRTYPAAQNEGGRAEAGWQSLPMPYNRPDLPLTLAQSLPGFSS